MTSTVHGLDKATEEEFLSSLYSGGEYLAAGRLDEARSWLEKAQGLQPRHEKALNLLGLTYFKLGDFPRAAAIYEALVLENPADATLRVNLGLVYLKSSDVPRSVKEFETATDLEPDHKKAHNYLGLALAQAGDYAKAREHFIAAGSDAMAEKMARALETQPPPLPSARAAAAAVPEVPPARPSGPAATVLQASAPPPESQEIEVMSDEDASVSGESAVEISIENPETPSPLAADWSAQVAPAAGAAPIAAEEPPLLDATVEALPVVEALAVEEPAPSVVVSPELAADADTGRVESRPLALEAAPPADVATIRVEGSAAPVPDEPPMPPTAGTTWDEALGSWVSAPEAPEPTRAETARQANPYDDGTVSEAAETMAPPPAQWAGTQEVAPAAWGGAERSAPEAGSEASWTHAEATPGRAPTAWELSGAEPVDEGTGADFEATWSDAPAEVPAEAPAPAEALGSEDTWVPSRHPAPVRSDAEWSSPSESPAEQATAAQEEVGAVDAAQATAAPAPAGDPEWLAQPLTDVRMTAGPADAAPEVAEHLATAVAEVSPPPAPEPTPVAEPLSVDFEEYEAPAQAAAPSDAELEFTAPARAAVEAEPPPEPVAEAPAIEAPAAVETPEPPLGTTAPGESGGYTAMGAPRLMDLGAHTQWVSEPSQGPFLVSPDGLAVSVTGEMLTRMTGLVAIVGSVEATPENKRIRGRSTEATFGAGPTQMHRVKGNGVLYLEPGKARFHAFDLDDEGAYLREERLFAFEEPISYENGRLQADGGQVLDLVHLKGQGRVLLQLEANLRAMPIPAGSPMVVPLARVVGWFGHVTPRLMSFAGQVVVELTGEGYALLGAAPERT